MAQHAPEVMNAQFFSEKVKLPKLQQRHRLRSATVLPVILIAAGCGVEGMMSDELDVERVQLYSLEKTGIE